MPTSRLDGAGGRTVGNTGHCSVCNGPGHNKRSCPQRKVAGTGSDAVPPAQGGGGMVYPNPALLLS